MGKVVMKILQGSVVTQTVLDGPLIIYTPVAYFLTFQASLYIQINVEKL